MRRYWGICLCLCLASCSRGPGWSSDHPAYPASGQVVVNGQPAGGAIVTFYHQDDWGAYSIVPQATTNSKGRFVLATYGAKDGAPAGDYQVTIEWPAYVRHKDWGPDKLGGKYAKRETSGLVAHIDKGKNELPPFELQVPEQLVKAGESAAQKGAVKKRKKER